MIKKYKMATGIDEKKFFDTSTTYVAKDVTNEERSIEVRTEEFVNFSRNAAIPELRIWGLSIYT